MNFNVDRLAVLSGITGDTVSSLNEAGNRSYHAGDTSDTPQDRWGNDNQLSEVDTVPDEESGVAHADKPGYGQGKYKNEAEEEEADTVQGSPMDELDDAEFLGEGSEEDIMLEIDENMIRKEIQRMKAERIQENTLREVIRNEIQSVFSSLGVDPASVSDSSWVYGDNAPQNSQEGYVNLAFPGMGFR